MLRSVHGGCRTTKMAPKVFMMKSHDFVVRQRVFMVKSQIFVVRQNIITVPSHLIHCFVFIKQWEHIN